MTIEANDREELLSLKTRWINADTDSHFHRMVIEKTPKGFVSRLETAPLVASTRLASGSIRSSLFAATDEARIPDTIATQVAEIFSGSIDFHRALRKGDRFSIVYETLEADGEPLRAGRVLSTEFVNAGKTHQAMWFQEPGQKGGYYNLDGQSLRRAYLASPMEFSRVTSGFKMRFHPILQTWRAHLGVDYGAPVGTPVRSVGGGVVEFAGNQGGFGNVVYIKHRNQHTTVYAHLSRIGVRKGQSVGQGDQIGAVGATGWATGPHLHFEFTEWWAAIAGGDAAGAFLGTQGDVWDTQWDMFLAGCGAIIAQVWLSRIHDRQLLRRHMGAQALQRLPPIQPRHHNI